MAKNKIFMRLKNYKFDIYYRLGYYMISFQEKKTLI